MHHQLIPNILEIETGFPADIQTALEVIHNTTMVRATGVRMSLHMCVRVCVRAGVCVSACMRARVHVCVFVCLLCP